MKKYQVIAEIGASVLEDVEADTPEQAIERASCHASLCHQCSDEVELGDPVSFVVLDEDGETVLDEEADERARVKALEAVAKAARKLVAAQRACDREAKRPAPSRSSAPMVRYIAAMKSLKAALKEARAK